MAKTKIKTGGITALNVTAATIETTLDVSGKTITLPASVSGLGTGITAAQLTSTLDLSSHTVTLPTSALSYPTFTSVTPSVATNDLTSLVIVGTAFGATGIPTVDFQSTTGVITPATTVVRDSATQLTVGCTLTTDGTYYIRIELNTGLAVRSATAVLTISPAPIWVTGSGSLGTFPGLSALPTQTLTATDATSFAITSGAIATPLTFTTGVGSCTITGTQTQHSVAATDSFTVTATDAEGQTAARAFTMTWSFGASSAGQFN